MGQRDPHISDTELGHGLISEKLANGEVSDGSVITTTLDSPFRFDSYPRLAQRLAGASLAAAMVARRCRVVVLRPYSAMTSLGEHGYGSRVT